MNPVIDSICAHRSIRAYRPDPIPEDTLISILHAAERASTSGNMQTYSIIVTKERDRRDKLWEIHYRQYMIQLAPVLLTFCADWHRMIRWCKLGEADPGFDNFLFFLVGAADAFIRRKESPPSLHATEIYPRK